MLGFQCDKFPAFFSAKSRFDCPGRANSFAEVAKAFLAMEQVSVIMGVQVFVSVPLGHVALHLHTLPVKAMCLRRWGRPLLAWAAVVCLLSKTALVCCP